MITILVEIHKEGIGSNTLMGKLYGALIKEKQDLKYFDIIQNEKTVVFHYDDTQYTLYPLGGVNRTPITGRELADEDIKRLWEQGWQVEELNA